MDETIPWDKKCKSSKELLKIKSSVDMIFDGVERCKQTIAKRTYFGTIDPFIQNTIEGNFSPQISAILANFEKFHSCLKEEMVEDLRYFNSLEHEEYSYADHMNAILGVYTKLDEVTNLQCDYLDAIEKCQRLEKELSKGNKTSKSFEALQTHAINLEIALQQCQEQIKNDKAFKENKSNEFLKEREQYFEIQDLKAQLQDKGITISELKKLIEKLKGKSVETKFEKSTVIRQPNAFKSQRQSILGKPATFSYSLAKKDFSKPVTAQIIPQNVKSGSKNTNVIAPGMYKLDNRITQTRTTQLPQDLKKTNKRVTFSTGVIATTSVSRPQLKSNQLQDRVMLNNSEVKTKENVQFAVDYSVRNPKHSITNLLQHPLRKQLLQNPLNKSLRKTFRMLIEHVSKGTSIWWYSKISPPGYQWKPKNSAMHVKTNVSLPLGNKSRNANTLESNTIRGSIMSNSPLSSNSFAAYKDNTVHRRLWVLKAYDEKSQASKLVQRGLHAQVRIVRTDRGTEFLNKTLHAYFAQEGIEHQTSTARTPEQNGVVKRQNCTLVGAARTMLSAANVPLFFWAEAIATACFTQNRSIIIPRHEKTPYHIINGRKPSVKFFHIFGSLCYIIRDGENLDKTKAKDQISSDPVPQCLTMVLEQDSLSPVPQSKENVPQTVETVTTSNELGLLFSPMFDELFNGSSPVVSKTSVVPTANARDKHQQQDTTPSTLIIQAPIHIPPVTPTENINQAKSQDKNVQVEEDKFVNIFSTPVPNQEETSSHGFIDPHHPDKVYRLKKALYGLKQAPRAWYDELSNFLVSKGFSKGVLDNVGQWSSKVQDLCTSMSIVETSMCLICVMCSISLWLRTQLTDYGFHFDKIPMYCDSKATIAISCNPVQHSRTKHIDVRYHFIKEQVEKGIVELFFVGTEYQLADLFTKALSEDRFKYLVRRLGMRCLTPAELEVLTNESA
ncbi:retrovirus-related pol polyprotein from transposon TNT 1-94 [Tanacetum coccineum]|uniref:Retrovirus-related pol polyprotein from transposon TNT 1-94 n=1 Tax=Tanacetum coccineum TaxID=301880 RepID=A0ABQ5ERY1_9ASTR